MLRISRLHLIGMVLLAGAVPGRAQSQAAPKAGASASSTKPPTDIYGRDTPRGTVSGLLSAMAERDYSRAGRYFEAKADVRRLTEELQSVLDRSGAIDPFVSLSNDPQGNLEDGLGSNIERVGSLSRTGDVPILLTRGGTATAGNVWRVALKTSIAARRLHEHRNTGKGGQPIEIGGAAVGDWSTLLGLASLVFLGFYVVSAGILFVMRRTIHDHERSRTYRVAQAAMPPVSLFGATLLFQLWAGSLPVSIIARQILLRYLGVFAWIALAWFFARMIDAVAQLSINRLKGLERRQAVSVISLVRRAAKLVLLFIAVVAVLDTFGIDVTTGVAALGIGGIALALGAQKTVENLVGSVTLIADKPVQVGDFCKVGDVVGTVEDVGIRSTRIRTLERTVVTIPNGDFSARQIENFARRDSFLFNPIIRLEHGIRSDKLPATLHMMTEILEANEHIIKPGARARLKDINLSSVDIEIFSYIRAQDFDESLIIRQDLLLKIHASLEKAKVPIAYATQTVHLKHVDTDSDDVPAEVSPIIT